MQFHLNGFEPGDPEIFDRSQRFPASGSAGALPDEVDVLIVGCGPAGPDAGGAAGGLSRHQDLHRRAEGRPPAARAGRRHRLPHHGDVRGLRLQRARAEGSVLDQRDDVLETGRQPSASTSCAAAGCRTPRTGCRNFRTSSSTRRACTTSISTSCAIRRRGSSRYSRGGWSICTMRPATATPTIR